MLELLLKSKSAISMSQIVSFICKASAVAANQSKHASWYKLWVGGVIRDKTLLFIFLKLLPQS